MAGKENLIPCSERSKDEVREIGRKGGIASGKARLKNKHGKELVRAILAMKEAAREDLEERIEEKLKK